LLVRAIEDASENGEKTYAPGAEPELALFDLPSLPPQVVAGQIDVFLAQRQEAWL